MPAPVWPAFSPATRKAFEEADRAISYAQFDPLDPYELASLLVHERADRHQRIEGVCAALAFIAGLERIGRAELLAINALITGYETTHFRHTPIWVGATGPSTAWHIGSPAEQLPKLMNATLSHAQRADLPASLRSTVGLMRILQIHPFRDGNGRTARVFAHWVMSRQLGNSRAIAHLLAALWCRHEFDLHSASVAVRDADDWQPYFERIFSWVSLSGLPPIRRLQGIK